MESGFTQAQFDALREYGGHRPKAPDTDAAIAVLQGAHYATKDWADNLKTALFPNGSVKARRAPINQGGNFAPYTWAKIYPYANSPKILAYTVGIDQDQSFIVKIDTVDASGALRKSYEAIRGPTNAGSSIASVIAAEEGLTMSREALLAWSIAAIRAFAPSYDMMVDMLGIAPPLRLVTDPTHAATGFAAWRQIMLEGALPRDGHLWIPEGQIVLDAPRKDAKGRMVVAITTDPTAGRHAVSIIDPLEPGSRHALSNIARDYRNRRFLVHQAKLSGSGANVSKEQFLARTGLTPVAIEAGGQDAERAWLIVADLGASPAEIRASTGRFAHYCALARITDADTNAWAAPPRNTFFPPGSQAHIAPDEIGGSYTVGARPAMDAKTVWRRHGIVSMTLQLLLANRGIVMRKLNHPLRFEIDAEILRAADAPLLLEIKTSISAADIHAGVGQLHLYSRLIPDLERHQRVLLLPRLPNPQIVSAVQESRILVHEFTYGGSEDGSELSFSEPFLTLCGV
jgi:hypothetical protein